MTPDGPAECSTSAVEAGALPRPSTSLDKLIPAADEKEKESLSGAGHHMGARDCQTGGRSGGGALRCVSNLRWAATAEPLAVPSILSLGREWRNL